MEKSHKEKTAIRGERLTTLRNMREWEEFLDVMLEEFEACFKTIMDGTGPETSEKDIDMARGGIKTIDRVLGKVGDNIRFGQKCRKEMWDQIKRQQQLQGTSR